MTPRNPLTIKRLRRPPPRSILRSQPVLGEKSIPGCQVFGNIVTTVYSAILREIAAKGSKARFQKTERGRFGIKA
jgi:hypothetical protein